MDEFETTPPQDNPETTDWKSVGAYSGVIAVGSFLADKVELHGSTPEAIGMGVVVGLVMGGVEYYRQHRHQDSVQVER